MTPENGGIKEYASCDRTLYIYQPGDWEAQTRSYVLVKTSTQEVVGAGHRSDVPVCPNGDYARFAGEPIKYDSGPPGCGTSSCQAFGVWKGCP
ncbi:hypothetical protein [Polyangium sp. 15x6]|uniref:hypothetical protein n=1 Tax=Polyangium sp. 15x6 TaxID=3042687 RepID=UPI00249CD184|nr:hypothetical protein [Polyangium sp. 15x6]MDI3291772.1 hypothetical protein [Polyangium sp. 15x6]